MSDPKITDQVSHIEDEIDLFQLLETLWRQKVVIGLSVLVFVLCALGYIGFKTITASKSGPLYEVKMEIRPGITHYSDAGFKAPVRGWTIDDIISWIQHETTDP